MKMLLFKPELGTLTQFIFPKEDIGQLVGNKHFDAFKVVIDDFAYMFYVGYTDLKIGHKNHWSFYQMSAEQCFYGNIAIEASDAKGGPRDITAEDILNIKSHIVVNPKGYMIYLQ